MTDISRYGNPPRRLHIRTSGSCNNNCLFCCDRHPQIERRNPRAHGSVHLTLPDFIEEISADKNSGGILFTSGEPTINKDLATFIALSKKGGYKNIALQTNGRLLSYQAYAETLLENGLNEINVSLHGSKKEIHDALTRSPGAFEQTRQGLLNLLALKKKYDVTLLLNFTVTKLNLADIYDYLCMVEDLSPRGQIQGVVFNVLMYAGNAQKYFDILCVSYRDIVEEIKKTLRKAGHPAGERVAFSLSNMPLCLIEGIEDVVGIMEIPLQRADRKIKEWKRAAGWVKGRRCQDCNRSLYCKGFDTFYAEKIGWDEMR